MARAGVGMARARATQARLWLGFYHAEHVRVAERQVEGLDEDGGRRVVARQLAQRQHQPATRAHLQLAHRGGRDSLMT